MEGTRPRVPFPSRTPIQRQSLLLLRVLRILRRRRAWRPARRPRWLADRLTNWLTKTGACLHARLPYAQHIFRRVPDKFEKAVVLRVIVNDYRLPVDLAPDSNDVSAYDRRSIVARNGRIGVRARIRSRSAETGFPLVAGGLPGLGGCVPAGPCGVSPPTCPATCPTAVPKPLFGAPGAAKAAAGVPIPGTRPN